MTVGRVVIIGAGQAGAEAAFRLRSGGFAGDITLVGEEPVPPYQRPPLSKKYLSGELDLDRLLVKPASAYAEAGIALLNANRAVWIDRQAKRVRLEGGRELAYDALVLALGSRARKLPVAGADLPGVHLVRTVHDIDTLKPAFVPGARLVVVGAGYIGLEAAAVARQTGLEVTVLEAATRPLARVTGPEISGFFLDEHTRQGVQFRLGAQAAVILGEERVRGVGLSDGSEVAADLVIAGIGILPETQLAERAGLEVADGIVVDAQARTSDPVVYAIGDCARRPLVHYGRSGRLESVHNALEGGKIAAAMILGLPQPAEEAPWFWSDQYDLKLQIAGLSQGYDRIVLRGDPAERSFAAFAYLGARLLAVDAINRPAEFLSVKQMLQKRQTVAPELVADTSVAMKDILAQAVPA